MNDFDLERFLQDGVLTDVDDSVVPTDMDASVAPNNMFTDDTSDFDFSIFDLNAGIGEKADVDIKPRVVSLDMPQRMEDDSASGTSDACEEDVPNDVIDKKLMKIFPMDALRKPRSEFKAWRKTYKNKAVRNLTSRETKRLSAVRRVILARVYAERARVKKGKETADMKSHLSKLQSENQSLRDRVQRLEHILATLQARFNRHSK